ncbi:hypothetical protein, partial [Cytobacillus praedii]|uniref:hypothetical protein n=1 Tax=Cytobacillus praedii TaxID=1742358 RepID=UPI001E5BA608
MKHYIIPPSWLQSSNSQFRGCCPLFPIPKSHGHMCNCPPGPEGPQGPQGPQGPEGPQGPQGPQGP